MRRALRCDGVIPHGAGVADLPAMRAWLTERGAPSTQDVVTEGETPAGSGAAVVAPWADAGCTWWLETRWTEPADIRDRIAAGPPR
ncbi:hypothetical protein ACWKSP_12885 [Micromonosporaceae bacterium Da 78-11]